MATTSTGGEIQWRRRRWARCRSGRAGCARHPHEKAPVTIGRPAPSLRGCGRPAGLRRRDAAYALDQGVDFPAIRTVIPPATRRGRGSS